MRGDSSPLAQGAPLDAELIGILGHELRNPLHALLANLRLLEGLCHQAEGSRVLRRMRKNLDYVSGLVDDFSRLAQPSEPRPRRLGRLDELIERSVEVCRHLFDEKDQPLVVDLPPPDTLVEVDPVHIEQVLVNLLSNAARYTPPGGTIEVRGRVGDGEVAVEVVDSGCGLAESELEAVFEPFYRSPRAAAEVREGLGLGLSLARQLAARDGGRVTAESDGPGRGARFRLTLSGLARQGPRRVVPAARRVRGVAGGRRILLVEDDVDGAEALRELLTLEGHEVRVAASAAAALRECRTRRPQVILLDLGLPDRSGLDLLDEMMAEGLLAGVAVIALSGTVDAAVRRRSMAAGCQRYLVKPAPVEELLEAVGACDVD